MFGKKNKNKKAKETVEAKEIVTVDEKDEPVAPSEKVTEKSIEETVSDLIVEVELPGGMILDTEGIYLDGVLLNPTQVFNRLHAWADDNLSSRNATPEEITEDPMDNIDRVENIEK